MVDQQKLHGVLLGGHRTIGVRTDDHSFAYRCGTCRKCFGCIFNLYQAHPAVSGYGKFFVITESGNVNTCLIRHFDDGRSFFGLELAAINLNCDHRSNRISFRRLARESSPQIHEQSVSGNSVPARQLHHPVHISFGLRFDRRPVSA